MGQPTVSVFIIQFISDQAPSSEQPMPFHPKKTKQNYKVFYFFRQLRVNSAAMMINS